MLIKIENDLPVGNPILEENFRYLFPSEVFPLVLTPEIVTPFGYGMYDFSQMPIINWNQKLEEGVPEKDAYNIWRQKWNVVDLQGQELADKFTAIKAEMNLQINRWRLEANTSYFTHEGKQFDCDALSRSDIDGISTYISLYGTLPPTFPGAWKAKDNTLFAIPDVDTWKQFISSMVADGTSNFIKAQTLKAQLAAATTYEQVMALEW